MNSESTSKNIKKQSPLAENILETIQKDDVRMRPKWHFILNISLLVVGTILAALSLLYLVSFIVFTLRQNGSWFMPSFGVQGWGALFISLPWLLIFLALLFVIIVGFLVKKYSFAYGRPLLYSALGIIIFASVGGFLIALTPLHSGLLLQAEEKNLPVAGGMYNRFCNKHPNNITMGKVIEKIPSGFSLRNQEFEILMVEVSPRTIFPRQGIRVEEVVVVLGDRQGNIIKAYGVQPVGTPYGVRTAPYRRDSKEKNHEKNNEIKLK
ncbi:hypothetical protein IPN41_01870 [Candidatus Falkowbacteria bacterium]|nr:MAG: hypothetical protein IPN41_01870 [Candidatus Falkowbacteria bacterium]